MTVEIPITQFPYYENTVILDGESYVFTFIWSVRSNAWFLNIGDIIQGIKIVTGIDLLEPYHYNDDLPSGKLGAVRNAGRASKPGFFNFGIGQEITLVYEPV
jgi:hypothetical protein